MLALLRGKSERVLGINLFENKQNENLESRREKSASPNHKADGRADMASDGELDVRVVQVGRHIHVEIQHVCVGRQGEGLRVVAA